MMMKVSAIDSYTLMEILLESTLHIPTRPVGWHRSQRKNPMVKDRVFGQAIQLHHVSNPSTGPLLHNGEVLDPAEILSHFQCTVNAYYY